MRARTNTQAWCVLAVALVASLVVALPAVAHALTYDPDAVPTMELSGFTWDGTDYDIVPQGAAFDADGNMYVSDTNNACIVKFDPAGEVIDVLGQGFDEGDASLSRPYGLFVAGGYLYCADYSYGEVVKMTLDGAEVDFWTDQPGVRPYTCCGNDIAVDTNGIVFVASDDYEILRFDPADYANSYNETYVSFAETGQAMYGVALDGAGNIYGCAMYGEWIAKYLPNGTLDTTWANEGYAGSGWSDGTSPYYCEPAQIRFDDDGNLLVLDTCSNTVVVLNAAGEPVTYFPNEPDESGPIDPWLAGPSGLAVQGSKLLVADTGNGRVVGYGIASDSDAPVTTFKADSSTWMKSGGFTLTAVDEGSGVAATYYTINGGPEMTYAGKVNAMALGEVAVVYWSVDKGGNAETPRTGKVFMDRTPPVTTASTSLTFDGVATIDLAATDAQSGVASTYYQVLDGTRALRRIGTRVVYDTPGTFTLLYNSIDVAGNVEPTNRLVFTLRSGVYFSLSGPAVVAAGGAAPLSLQFESFDVRGLHGVTIQSSPNGSTWSDAGVADAPSIGVFIARPLVSTYYRAVFAGDADHSPATSPALLIEVPPVVSSGSITIGSSASAVTYPNPFVLSGVLKPGEVGDACVVYVKKPGSRRWSYSSARLAYAAADGGGVKWWYRYTPKLKGTYSFHVKFAGDSGAPAATSRTISVVVR
jgi:sugar lactone lactonase YvrE